MNEKRIAAVVLMAAVLLLSLTGCSFSRHKDITGVTTLTKENIVVMNSPTGEEFVSGSGTITVGQGEIVHLEYKLSEGSFDLALNAGDGSLDIFQSTDLENLPSDGEVFGRSGVTGSGELDIEAPAGEYTVFFNMHGAAGSATVSAAKG